MTRQIFISCGQKQKKLTNKLSTRNLYLNYGLLAVASTFKKDGYDVVVYQADYKSPVDFYNFLNNSEDLVAANNLFLSIYTYYTLEWTIEFCRIISDAYPHIKLIAGGKWVITSVDEIPKLKSLIPSISVFVLGNFSYSPSDFIGVTQSSIISLYNEQLKTNETTTGFLYINTLYNFSDYTPSIEISHGCGMGCDFCVDKNLKRTKDKSPASIMSEIDRLEQLYDCNDFRIYYEVPHFKPTLEWCHFHNKTYSRGSKKYLWRCQTRVDTLDEQKLSLLYQSGLRVLDLGLESASPTQLLKMKKTKNPEKYLKTAEKLLINCKNTGIWCKTNIMLYQNENYRTLQETTDWIISYKSFIKGVSAYPFITYGLDIHSPSGSPLCIKQAALSSDFSFVEAERETINISRIMSFKDYFDLKSFGYFPRSYSFNNFLTDLESIKDNWRELPFTIDESEFRMAKQRNGRDQEKR
jgi:radical SAM superfamily enzyme YgiQ (UPF0313 family)